MVMDPMLQSSAWSCINIDNVKLVQAHVQIKLPSPTHHFFFVGEEENFYDT